MNYYELSQSPKVENPIMVMGLDREEYCHIMRQEDFAALDRLKVAYFSGSESEELCDILTEPTFMVSDRLKKLIVMYDKEMEFKGVQIFPKAGENEMYPLYWIPGLPQVDCIHKSSIIYDNGTIPAPVLDGERIGGMQIFRLAGCLEYKVVVSMSVAESILRRRFYGIGLKKLEVA